MWTTAVLDLIRSVYVDGSKAEAECQETRSTHLGVWPAGVVYGLPDELRSGALYGLHEGHLQYGHRMGDFFDRF